MLKAKKKNQCGKKKKIIYRQAQYNVSASKCKSDVLNSLVSAECQLGWLTGGSPHHASSSAVSSREVWTAASSLLLPVCAAPLPPSWPSQQPSSLASVSSNLGCGFLPGLCQEPGKLTVTCYYHFFCQQIKCLMQGKEYEAL